MPKVLATGANGYIGNAVAKAFNRAGWKTSEEIGATALAYVTLAEHPRRAEIKGQAFNISNSTYEATCDVCEALVRSYGLSPKSFENIVPGMIEAVLQYSQWVSSEKIRHFTLDWVVSKASFLRQRH